jgi:O-succinylbenzoate synthase
MSFESWVHRYQITPRNQIGVVADTKPRSGALLKVVGSSGVAGFSDVFPWPEYGDAALDDQLASLAAGRPTALVQWSLQLAEEDAKLRSQGKNAFENEIQVKNHYTITDCSQVSESAIQEALRAGFTSFKVKVGRSLQQEAQWVSQLVKHNTLKVRVDFGGRTALNEFKKFFSFLNAHELKQIEFAEDPCPFQFEEWREASKIVPIAVDFESEKINWELLSSNPPFSVFIFKPGRTSFDKIQKWIDRFSLKIVVTSSLDHPVGVAHACRKAIELKKIYGERLLDCGCLTFKNYQPNAFSEVVQSEGPYLKGIPGTGIGFNNLVEAIEWKK